MSRITIKRTLTLISFMLIQYSFVEAAEYNRAIVAQYLEEQSYHSLLELVENIPNEEHDNYLLNAAGYAAFQSALYDQSAAYYYRSVQKDSSNVQANLYLGVIKKQQKKFQEALFYYKRLLGIRPNQARFLKNVADCYAGLKNDDSQTVYLTKAYSVAPKDLNIAYSFAEALYTQKNIQKPTLLCLLAWQLILITPLF
jgi:tetratricopeptide (TPR) repeat protein